MIRLRYLFVALLLPVQLLSSPDIEAAENVAEGETDLFRSLDLNADGKVSADEVPESRRSFFLRAVRVADQNGDGALSAEELAIATAETPRSQPSERTPPFGGRNRPGNNINLRQLDRNNDGQLSLDEVPEPFRPRLKEIMERTGQKSVAVEMLERLSRMNPSEARPSPSRPAGTNASPSPDTNPRSAPGVPAGSPMQNTQAAAGLAAVPLRLLQNFDQADANSDGGIDREELVRAFRQMADRMR